MAVGVRDANRLVSMPVEVATLPVAALYGLGLTAGSLGCYRPMTC